MTMYVDPEACTGCGACIEACPNDAISLVVDKAVVDEVLCTSCQTCAGICPTGALNECSWVVPVESQPEQVLETLQSAAPSAPKPAFWSEMVLPVVGQQLLPRLVDILVSVLERRLALRSAEGTTLSTRTNMQRDSQTSKRARGLQRRKRVRMGKAGK
jgi:NAD-dependent dihydropyrimidine dehydrogenase PreA subunit